MAEDWYTYAQLGERLGISPAAVRQKAIRARWPRRPANDGKTQVRVDLVDVRAVTAVRKLKEGPSADSRPTPVERPSDTRTLAALQEHIETLKGELQAQRVEREAERETLRGTVEALKAALEAERQLKGELRRELERLSRPWWRRLLAKAA
jgi:vacuolar-type H+-ATPase subunit I/STV1